MCWHPFVPYAVIKPVALLGAVEKVPFRRALIRIFAPGLMVAAFMRLLEGSEREATHTRVLVHELQGRSSSRRRLRKVGTAGS